MWGHWGSERLRNLLSCTESWEAAELAFGPGLCLVFLAQTGSLWLSSLLCKVEVLELNNGFKPHSPKPLILLNGLHRNPGKARWESTDHSHPLASARAVPFCQLRFPLGERESVLLLNTVWESLDPQVSLSSNFHESSVTSCSSIIAFLLPQLLSSQRITTESCIMAPWKVWGLDDVAGIIPSHLVVLLPMVRLCNCLWPLVQASTWFWRQAYPRWASKLFRKYSLFQSGIWLQLSLGVMGHLWAYWGFLCLFGASVAIPGLWPWWRAFMVGS